ncbi:MAG: hypothetical protein J7M29_08735 [Verrucomicrobia bacterium]|nr:hypothetical protein [Verrucomicrobiota bacterium]
MRVYLTLLWREFSAYLYSFTGYVIIGAVLFLIGASFTVMLAAYNGDSAAAPLTELFTARCSSG